MTPILHAHTCHPEACTPRHPQLQIASRKGWVINQQSGGPSLSFGMTTRGVCLLHSIRHRQCQLQPLAHICRCAQPARAVHFYPMHDLFAKSEAENLERVSAAAPLAARMRPRTLDEFVGQEHILAPGKPLRTAVERGTVGSLIFWGPPGSGKTTLAMLIAATTQRVFVPFSAVSEGVPRIREIIAESRDRLDAGGARTILFIDEIHRLNKAQQDSLLPAVEEG